MHITPTFKAGKVKGRSHINQIRNREPPQHFSVPKYHSLECNESLGEPNNEMKEWESRVRLSQEAHIKSHIKAGQDFTTLGFLFFFKKKVSAH